VNVGRTVRGKVVDPKGRPLEGISVMAVRRSGGMIQPSGVLRNRANSRTDKNGQFELPFLPEGPLRIMAFKPKPGGGRIENPAEVSVKAHQTEVRIVLDLGLNAGVEDLDKPGQKNKK
jgi:Carboxypeptidase regulatory-like domain